MDVRNKLKIIEMFKTGATVPDVLKKFPEVTKGTLVALKANVTRGTYDQ